MWISGRNRNVPGEKHFRIGTEIGWNCEWISLITQIFLVLIGAIGTRVGF